jgi:hypothetical protein
VCLILFLELVDLEDMMGAMGCDQAPQGPARQIGVDSVQEQEEGEGELEARSVCELGRNCLASWGRHTQGKDRPLVDFAYDRY